MGGGGAVIGRHVEVAHHRGLIPVSVFHLTGNFDQSVGSIKT